MSYSSARTQFEKIVLQMQNDLEKYAGHDAAKDAYIEKQNNIIKVLVNYFNETEKEKIFWEKQNGEYRDLVMKYFNKVKSCFLVIEMTHLSYPHPANYSDKDIEEIYGYHIKHCNHRLHEYAVRKKVDDPYFFPHITISTKENIIACNNCGTKVLYPIDRIPRFTRLNEVFMPFITTHKNCKDSIHQHKH